MSELVARRKRTQLSNALFARYAIPERQPMALRERDREGLELELHLTKEP